VLENLPLDGGALFADFFEITPATLGQSTREGEHDLALLILRLEDVGKHFAANPDRVGSFSHGAGDLVQRDDRLGFGPDIDQDLLAVHPHDYTIDHISPSMVAIGLRVVIQELAHLLAGPGLI
jgi:hypothetical protein